MQKMREEGEKLEEVSYYRYWGKAGYEGERLGGLCYLFVSCCLDNVAANFQSTRRAS